MTAPTPGGWYLATRAETHVWLWEVWASSEADAAAKLKNGEGQRVATLSPESGYLDPFTDIHYDPNEGMGR